MSNELSVSVINDVTKTKSRHIYVLVPGTSDPVNTNKDDQDTTYGKTTGRANSYDSESMYWHNDFYKRFKELEAELTDFIVFDQFGWSGNNCISNREVSGKYLVRRFCMKDKYNKQGYYESLNNEPILFHLIGHSHGGNVMNEMTKEMSALGSKWPKKWKIKSLTYLSTPFFEKLHQVKVDESFFHKDAEILHVYNDYDLTQNFVADFSMFSLDILDDLLKAKRILSTREESPKDKPKGKGKIIKKGLIDKCKTAYSNIPTNKLSDLWLTEEEGRGFYDNTILFFDSLEFLFNGDDEGGGLFELITALNIEIKYKVSNFLKETIPKDELKIKRKILDDQSYLILKNILERILIDIITLKERFDSRITDVNAGNSSYSRNGILEDLSFVSDLINTLTSILDIDENTLVSDNSNSIWNMLYKILNNSIEKFDDTYVFPEQQFKGSFLENKIYTKKGENTSGLNVTTKDEYDIKTAQTESASDFTRALIRSNTTPFFGIQQGVDDSLNPKIFSQRYYELLSSIKVKEKEYDGNKNQTNLMDLLFTLLSHSSVHSSIDTWSSGGILGLSIALNNTAEISLARFKTVIIKLKTIFNSRYVGNLEAFNMGTLMHFMKVSHSTSRKELHKEVEDFLRRLGPEN